MCICLSAFLGEKAPAMHGLTDMERGIFMAKKYILALDQGTPSSRAIIFNNKGELGARADNAFSAA